MSILQGTRSCGVPAHAGETKRRERDDGLAAEALRRRRGSFDGAILRGVLHRVFSLREARMEGEALGALPRFKGYRSRVPGPSVVRAVAPLKIE